MDLGQIIAVGVTALLSIGVVGTFVVKYSSKAKKYITIASELFDLLNAVIKSVEDKTITNEEVADIKLQAEELIAALK